MLSKIVTTIVLFMGQCHWVAWLTAFAHRESSRPQPKVAWSQVLGETRARTELTRRRLDSFTVSFTARAIEVNTGRPSAFENHHELRVLGEKRALTTTHRSGAFEYDMDVMTNHILVYKSDAIVFWPVRGYCLVSRGRGLEEDGLCNFFLECTGLWPSLDETRTFSRPELARPIYNHELIAAPECRVIGEEVVYGALCYVIDAPDGFTLWVDPLIGYECRRREIWLRSGGRRSSLKLLYTLSDYRPFADDLWIPYRFERTVSQVESSGSSPPTETALFRVLCLVTSFDTLESLGALDPETFRPPAGTIVEQRDTGERKQIPGGEGLLDTVADVSKKRLSVHRKLAEAIEGSRYPPVVTYAVGIGIGFCATVAVAYLALRMRFRLSPQRSTAHPTNES